MGVEAIVVGSVTDFDAFYPPRMALTVHWYAANEGFHPIPAGYGLPWGTEQEQQIPSRIAREAEFELARSQLATQTPLPTETVVPVAGPDTDRANGNNITQTSGQLDLSRGVQINNGLRPVQGSRRSCLLHRHRLIPKRHRTGIADPFNNPFGDPPTINDSSHAELPGDDGTSIRMTMTSNRKPTSITRRRLPNEWPDPTDLIPDPPSPVRPVATRSTTNPFFHTRGCIVVTTPTLPIA